MNLLGICGNGALGSGSCSQESFVYATEKNHKQLYDEVLIMRLLKKDQLSFGSLAVKRSELAVQNIYIAVTGFFAYIKANYYLILTNYLVDSSKSHCYYFACFCYVGCIKYSLECYRPIFFQMIRQDMGWRVFVYAYRYFHENNTNLLYK